VKTSSIVRIIVAIAASSGIPNYGMIASVIATTIVFHRSTRADVNSTSAAPPKQVEEHNSKWGRTI
jgi:hypothetical protein